MLFVVSSLKPFYAFLCFLDAINVLKNKNRQGFPFFIIYSYVSVFSLQQIGVLEARAHFFSPAASHCACPVWSFDRIQAGWQERHHTGMQEESGSYTLEKW
jgi:hypothetical protein